ncbi:hypothetical protein Pmani_015192 [Petrolisthes manimaculis]|uniref:Uncharacterized protein n=1 Tax=Petrolisthes manimaculis TaxID=1843537 RepID=A0AAE1PSQ3_9EUCA|nr:hypothetical protein Pmani_015192 [Petrolisthes manimaculis]
MLLRFPVRVFGFPLDRTPQTPFKLDPFEWTYPNTTAPTPVTPTTTLPTPVTPTTVPLLPPPQHYPLLSPPPSS